MQPLKMRLGNKKTKKEQKGAKSKNICIFSVQLISKSDKQTKTKKKTK